MGLGLSALTLLVAGGCQAQPGAPARGPDAESKKTATPQPAQAQVARPRRETYTPRPYPLDERGFSPVDKALAKAFARDDMVAEDDEGSLNPYVLKVISALMGDN
jgi:hypothetical protein